MRCFARLVALSLVLCAGHASAQPAAPDPALQQAKAVFEALDPETRKAIQRDLVWAGGFQGAASGEFGSLTFAALRRFETAAKLPVNGQITPEKRAAIAKAADAGRAVTGFRVETDRATTMRIGVPTKLLSKRSTNASGSDRWQDAGDKATLDLQVIKSEEDLAALFEKGTDAKVAGRKITYKLLRPDFFVISGETAGGKFYRRVEKGPGGALRGFSIGYDKALAGTMDALVIAMASTFEPFPAARAPSGSGQVASAGSQVPANPNAGKPKRITAVLVAPNLIVTSELAIRACKSLAVDGRARMMASVEKQDAATGLALIRSAVPGVDPAVLAANGGRAGGGSEGLLIQRDLDGKVLVSPATISGGFARAAMQEGGAGAPVFSAGGQLVGLLASEPVAKYAIAGVIPQVRHTFQSAQVIAEFAGVTPTSQVPEPSAMTAGDIAAKAGGAVVSLFCGS